jgi:pimeloyl-ACP methyl ester carboxylesterase
MTIDQLADDLAAVIAAVAPEWPARARGPLDGRHGLRWLLLGSHPDAGARRITVAAVAGCRPGTISGFRPTLDGHERSAALAAFAHTPAVVLAGTRDRLTPVPMARRIADALPAAQLTVFPGAGHMLPVERPAGVAARLAALVDQREARQAAPGQAG